MSFSYDPSMGSDLDKLRFLIEDTDPGIPYFQDEELYFLLSEWMPKYDSVYYVAAQAAEKLAVRFSTMPDVSADGISVSLSSLADQYRKLAAQLRETYKASQIGGEIDLGNIMVGTTRDPSIRPLRFSWGLHDNPEAGNQDYGGMTYDPFSGASGGYYNEDWM